MELELSLRAGRLRLKRPRWDLAGQEFDLRHAGEFARELSIRVYRAAVQALFPFLFSRSFYFPAARSGILQAHRALASSLIGQASLFGIEHVEVPKLTGVVADFIVNILHLEKRPRPSAAAAAVAELVESEVCQGKVDLRPREAVFEYPEI